MILPTTPKAEQLPKEGDDKMTPTTHKRLPNIPFYFTPGEQRNLPFYAWDIRGNVKPVVGDYYLQSDGKGGHIRIEVVEVDSEARTFVLEAVSGAKSE